MKRVQAHPTLAFFIGSITGIIGGFVKLGWEIPFPPRTPERKKIEPPEQFLLNLGVDKKETEISYTYNENKIPILSMVIHFGFSIGAATLYSILAEYYPKITKGEGSLYGIGCWFLSHIVVMPALKIVPKPQKQPLEEHLSELFGHIIWMWVIELTRDDLKRRILPVKNKLYLIHK